MIRAPIVPLARIRRSICLDAETRACGGDEAQLDKGSNVDRARPAILADLAYAGIRVARRNAARHQRHHTGRGADCALPEAFPAETIIEAMPDKSAWNARPRRARGGNRLLSFTSWQRTAVRARAQCDIPGGRAAPTMPLTRESRDGRYISASGRHLFDVMGTNAHVAKYGHAIGAAFCLAAVFFLDRPIRGHRGRFAFMVLDTVEVSSTVAPAVIRWGNIFDYGSTSSAAILVVGVDEGGTYDADRAGNVSMLLVAIICGLSRNVDRGRSSPSRHAHYVWRSSTASSMAPAAQPHMVSRLGALFRRPESAGRSLMDLLSLISMRAAGAGQCPA